WRVEVVAPEPAAVADAHRPHEPPLRPLPGLDRLRGFAGWARDAGRAGPVAFDERSPPRRPDYFLDEWKLNGPAPPAPTKGGDDASQVGDDGPAGRPERRGGGRGACRPPPQRRLHIVLC